VGYWQTVSKSAVLASSVIVFSLEALIEQFGGGNPAVALRVVRRDHGRDTRRADGPGSVSRDGHRSAEVTSVPADL